MSRAIIVTCVVVASFTVVSLAHAAFVSTATGGAQSVTSASLSPASALGGSCNSGTASLHWTATPSTFADGYEILRGTASGGPYTHLASVSGRTTVTYNDSTIGSSGSKYYVVKATKGNWRSASTSQVRVFGC